PTGRAEEGRIVAYLQAGVCLAAAGGVQRDVLDPSSGVYTSPDMLTDGIWLWPGELAHYVAAHHVELPAAFVAHMRRHGWLGRPLGAAERAALGGQLFNEWREQAGRA